MCGGGDAHPEAAGAEGEEVGGEAIGGPVALVVLADGHERVPRQRRVGAEVRRDHHRAVRHPAARQQLRDPVPLPVRAAPDEGQRLVAAGAGAARVRPDERAAGRLAGRGGGYPALELPERRDRGGWALLLTVVCAGKDLDFGLGEHLVFQILHGCGNAVLAWGQNWEGCGDGK